MANRVRKSRVRDVPLSDVKDNLSRYLRKRRRGEIVITRHGRPAGVNDRVPVRRQLFDYRLENGLRFLARIEQARRSLRAGREVNLENLRKK